MLCWFQWVYLIQKSACLLNHLPSCPLGCNRSTHSFLTACLPHAPCDSLGATPPLPAPSEQGRLYIGSDRVEQTQEQMYHEVNETKVSGPSLVQGPSYEPAFTALLSLKGCIVSSHVTWEL